MTCELCHESSRTLVVRYRLAVCDECAAGFDYDDSLTPAERRAEEESMAIHVNETNALRIAEEESVLVDDRT